MEEVEMKRRTTSVVSFYGSCRNIPTPNFSLQPMGEGWKYPQWHVNFLTGQASRDEPLNRIAKELLESLADGEWHRKTPHAVGVGTIEACVHLGLVKCRLIPKKDEPGASWGEYKITQEGREVLKRNRLLPQLVN